MMLLMFGLSWMVILFGILISKVSSVASDTENPN